MIAKLYGTEEWKFGFGHYDHRDRTWRTYHEGRGRYYYPSQRSEPPDAWLVMSTPDERPPHMIRRLHAHREALSAAAERPTF